MSLVAVVLAAGRATRMGGDKLAMRYRGERVLHRALAPFLAHPDVGEVLLVVRPGFAWPDHALRCTLVENPDCARGMGCSLAAGVAAAPADAEGFLIGLGDMPELTVATVGALVAAFRAGGGRVAVPICRGRNGHPVIFPPSYRERLLALDGDVGARALLRAHPDDVLPVAVDDPGVVFDVDTPADLADEAPRPAAGGVWPWSDAAPLVVVRGAGELASAVAHRLVSCGLRVAMTEVAQPAAIRRLVCFAAAVQHGRVEVEGIAAVRVELDRLGAPAEVDWSAIPVVVDPDGELVRCWRPAVVVDGRLLKRAEGISVDDAPLVVGLGPGLLAGRDAHVVVETNRGHDLGRLVTQGQAAPDTGIPGTIAERTAERVLRAPAAGTFTAVRDIGELVRAGELVGRVGRRRVESAIAGVVRGLICPGYEVERGQKIGDVDPRGDAAYCATISDKGRAIAGSCLEAIVAWHGRRR